ncbi:hypothetical protein [Buchnera aphidicola]|uniref:Flagellar motor switch protein FliM n=1 Tax=Buchnera aphidicola (Cinara laricifoliae) TaxID=2518977 RepID=A0A451DAY5_9GAMM|nr:hypothetical protein [Buchnera aphidicola]VFP83520.1 Flagellar motor switch protein FliM [Buchnera aphidicola (Cinara laricifoliae)]
MSQKSNFWFKRCSDKKLSHINFMNFVLNKQSLFFKKLFNDFVLLFNKKFSEFFSCSINIKFIHSRVECTNIQSKSVYLKYIGKQFFLRGYTDKCLILITKDLFIIFIDYLFGNFNENISEYLNLNNLTYNEINILDILLKKIFIICDSTFLKNISISIINNCKFTLLKDLLYRRFIGLPYICFTFKIYIYDRINILKIYIPNYIVSEFYK